MRRIIGRIETVAAFFMSRFSSALANAVRWANDRQRSSGSIARPRRRATGWRKEIPARPNAGCVRPGQQPTGHKKFADRTAPTPLWGCGSGVRRRRLTKNQRLGDLFLYFCRHLATLTSVTYPVATDPFARSVDCFTVFCFSSECLVS